jgi:hypothetical protein
MLIFGNDVKPVLQKYFSFSEMESRLWCALSCSTGGAYRDRHGTLAAGCDGRFGFIALTARTNGAEADG